MDISDSARAELRKLANANLSVPGEPIDATASAADFCTIFGEIKPILQSLIPVFGLIPGVGKKVAAALTALLALGSAICPG